MGWPMSRGAAAAAVLLLLAVVGAVRAARGDHDYDEMFTTESTSTTTVSTSPRPTTTSTLSPAMLLYEERRQRARRGHGLGLGRYWRRRHALSHARRVAAGASRCADGETLDMLRFAPSGPDEALRSLMVGDAALPTGGALLQHARKAQFVFTGKVLGRGDRVGRDTAARENATAAGRRGRQTHELVPRGAAVWVRVKRVLKGDLEHSLVHLQTEPANGGRAPPGTAAPCPQLLRLHHTAIFLADKPRGSAWGRHRGGAAADAEANALPGDDDNAVELLLTADPFVLTLRNLQISSKASKGKPSPTTDTAAFVSAAVRRAARRTPRCVLLQHQGVASHAKRFIIFLFKDVVAIFS